MASIAIIGGGFSGVLTAHHLLNAAEGPLRVLLIERSDRATGGVAYGTACPLNVLNVPAGRMSAFDDDPSHFLRWAQSRDASVHGATFVPRPVYGEYIASILAETQRTLPRGSSLERISGEATTLRRTALGWEIALLAAKPDPRRAGTTSTLPADLVVIAGANAAPADPPVREGAEFYASPRYTRNPWANGALDVGADEPVLLIGTGLTMMDVAIALRHRGHTGPIHAVSRRGLLPQPHRVGVTPPAHHPRPATLDQWPRTALGYLKGVRAEVALGAKKRVDWREVVTSLRADTPRLWRELPVAERRRFLARLRPFWDTHRHRTAPETAAIVADMLASGRLHVHAARLRAYREDATGVSVRLEPREGEPHELRIARVINCTGPDTDVRTMREPLIRALEAAGHIRPDPLALGIDCDDEGRALDAAGRAQVSLIVVGPHRKAELWEATAVPELRGQTRATAAFIARTIAERQPAAAVA